MRASVQLLLYKAKTLKDGRHPVVLQYIINRKVKKQSLAKAFPSEWDEKKRRLKGTAPNSGRTNAMLAEKLAAAEDLVFNINQGKASISTVGRPSPGITIAQAAALETARLEEGFKVGASEKLRALINQIPDTDTPLAAIDKPWLDQFVRDQKKLGNIGSTIQMKLKRIRGLIDRYNQTPVTREMRSVTVPKAKSTRVKLSKDEVATLEQLSFHPNDRAGVARDLFLLQIYLRGARVGDVLQARSEDFNEGRFVYSSDKTDTAYSIKLIDRASAIVERYRGRGNYLFHFFNWTPNKQKSHLENERDRINAKKGATAVVNRLLKAVAAMAGIKKPLSSHIARHTFARMAIDKISNPMITMELLGHTSLAVHQAYLNDIRKDDVLDSAADDIFD